MAQVFFVTGTDTHVGKTFATVALLRALQRAGHSALGLKPLASGCEWQQGRWKNEDALQLQQASSVDVSYETINPIALPEPVAPHLAARQRGVDLSVKMLLAALQPGLQVAADVILIEGAGGWLVPLNVEENFSDLARAMSLPVILVVGLRLGCINHALLSVAAIEQAGLQLAGWVANSIDPTMVFREENIQMLRQKIAAPCLAVLPYCSEPAEIAATSTRFSTAFVV